MVVCLERGADLHMSQLMPLPLTVSCSSKIQIGFTFLVPAHPGSPGKRAVKWCVCVLHLLSRRRISVFGHVARLDNDTHRQTWLFSSTSTYHSTDLLTARGVAHLVVHRTSGLTSYETIPPVRLESSGGVLSTVDMVVQRRDGPRRLHDHDDDTMWAALISRRD